MENINLTKKWDKVFPKSDKVSHEKVFFTDRFGFTIAADIYKPLEAEGKLAAIAVCGPYGAIKEQSSGLYAQTLAERGFMTIAFDPIGTGESSGLRHVSSPALYTEQYSAVVDYLMTRDDVDEERIGALGICGWGGFVVNAASQDCRIKATVSCTMGAFDMLTREERIEMRKKANAQRTIDARNGSHALEPVLPELDQITDETPDFVREFVDYYKVKGHGYHERSVNSAGTWQTINWLQYYTYTLRDHIDEIEGAVLLVAGEKAYSRAASEETFKCLTGDNKELLIVPGATHVDLYHRTDLIPFNKIETFYQENLK